MRNKQRAAVVGAAALALAMGAAGVIAQRSAVRRASEAVGSPATRTLPGLVPNENLLFNGWGVTPAGSEHVRLEGDMPLRLAVAPDGRALAAVTAGYNKNGLTLIALSPSDKRAKQFLPLDRAWNGLAWSRDGKRLFVSGGSSGQLHVFDYAEGRASFLRSVAPAPAAGLPNFLAGIAVHPRTGALYVCNEGGHEVWQIDPETLARSAVIPVGAHPHSLAFGADPRYLYVTNWAGRSVSVIDVQTNRRVRDLPVGVRPNDLALAPDGRLFVACAGDNTVHVIQTRMPPAAETPEATPAAPPRERVREIIATSLYPSSPEGSTPCAVTVSPDGKTLYVANADNNSVLVADVAEPEASVVAGFVPTGWYPTAVAVSPADGTLFVGNGKGLRSRPSFPPITPGQPAPRRGGVAFTHPGRLLEGSVSVIARPTPEQMAAYTAQVRRNSPYTPETLRQAPIASESVIPDTVGRPGPIKYVLYIIKENRTYDQILGDFRDARGWRAGNGDPDLVLFGEDVTPNHHQIARDYVLLDNLYCNGEVSRDGHSWCDAAIATDYKQRAWVLSYSGKGDIPGADNDELNVPTAGFLWDLCQRHGVPFRCYGEGAGSVPNANRGRWPGGQRDRVKVDNWIRDLQATEKGGELPRFMIMSLGEDHTQGTTPGAPTPEAAVASNDIGLGKIVAAATRSRFWKELAIFVIEDDAQNGPDHVDAHRTVGLVISPYVRRGTVDSTLYTTAGMVRTMELILGLPPLTQYDAGATPLFRCFGRTAQVVPYDLRTPKVDVNGKNAANAPGARASARMNWDEYDDFDAEGEDTLNRILWHAAKGPNVPYPAPIHRAVFTR